MKLSTLQRLGGLATILGSFLLTAWAICWTTLLPIRERARDASALVRDPDWVWIASLALAGLVLMIFGLTAVYSRLYSSAGVTGLLGYLFVVTAYILQAAKVTWEVFVYPVIVGHEPSLPLFRDKLLMVHPQVALFRMLATVAILLGVVLFGTTLIRSKEFPKSAGVLLLSGAVVYAVAPGISIYLAVAGVPVLSAGCFVLGYTLAFGKGARQG
jgi:hypothetical protein